MPFFSNAHNFIIDGPSDGPGEGGAEAVHAKVRAAMEKANTAIANMPAMASGTSMIQMQSHPMIMSGTNDSMNLAAASSVGSQQTVVSSGSSMFSGWLQRMTPGARALLERDLAEARIQLAKSRHRKNQKIANGKGHHGRSRSDQGHCVGGSVGRADGRPLPAIESSATITEMDSSELRSPRAQALPSSPNAPPSRTPTNMMMMLQRPPPPPPGSTAFRGAPPPVNFPIHPPGILPPPSFDEWLTAGGPNLPLQPFVVPPGLPQFLPGMGVQPGAMPPPNLSVNPSGIPFVAVPPPQQLHPHSEVTGAAAIPTDSEPTIAVESNQEDTTEEATLKPESDVED